MRLTTKAPWRSLKYPGFVVEGDGHVTTVTDEKTGVVVTYRDGGVDAAYAPHAVAAAADVLSELFRWTLDQPDVVTTLTPGVS